MALKLIIKSLDEVAENLQSLYTRVGDDFVLDTDDSEYKSKLSEFRNNNIDLKKKVGTAEEQAQQLQQLQEQLKQFEGVDPEAARAAMEQARAMEDKKLIDAGKIDELLAQRTESMRQDYETQLKAALKARDEAQESASSSREQLSKVVIDNDITTAVTGVATVRKGAMTDVLSRARNVWKLDENGVPVPRNAQGEIMYGKDGENPVSMTEWAQGLRSEFSYLFEGNAGGGAGGNDDERNMEPGKVNASDVDAVGANLEKIASGEVTVVQ